MDDGEFVEALDMHLERLRRLTRRLTGSPHDAEDLLSETCLLALRGWRRGTPQDPAAWFTTVCLNAARSSHRRRAARPVEVLADHSLLTQVAAGSDTAKAALAAVEARHVRAALALLPAPQLEAITLMDLKGYTAAEVAQILGAPRGTVLARVRRGRRVLATLLVLESDLAHAV